MSDLYFDILRHLPAPNGTQDDLYRFNLWFLANGVDATDDQQEDDMCVSIESILYQWGDFRDTVSVTEVIASIWREVLAYSRRAVIEELAREAENNVEFYVKWFEFEDDYSKQVAAWLRRHNSGESATFGPEEEG